LLLLVVCVCLTGCEQWTRQEGIVSFSGEFTVEALPDCLKRCLETSTCAAVDVYSSLCIVHTNLNHTATESTDFTRYILNRACQSTTPTSASTTQTTIHPSSP